MKGMGGRRYVPAWLPSCRQLCVLLHCMSPLMAQSGHPAPEFQCSLLGVKRTSHLTGAMSAFDPKRTSVVAETCGGRSRCGGPPQSPAPGCGEKYCSLSGFPSHSLESAGGAFLTVIFGQIFAYFAFSDNHSSSPRSVSGCIASTGHSGTQTLQSMHWSGWITSMFSPS